MEGILSTVIGVVGTMIGTILGYALNSWGNRGKIEILNIKIDEEYERLDGLGCMVKVENITEAENYNLMLSFNVYNSSNNVKIMKEIKFNFYNEQELIKEYIPYDESTKRPSSYTTARDKIIPANILPKSINQMNLSCFLNENDLKVLSKSNSISLSYENEKNKITYIKIKTDKS